jgi:hypothetical protein
MLRKMTMPIVGVFGYINIIWHFIVHGVSPDFNDAHDPMVEQQY